MGLMMRTASQCMAMAVRMDGLAARVAVPSMRAEWTSMALYWRGLASQADWQDRYAARRL
ncbi:hypothetical protein [Brevundimonas sp. Root1423]|uniref:hypothetical protein n=1 Tax=Brevundimonas sp. Root1423 TaxID=1736462 RepID=UPI0006F27495|nr:hypothetical protein [Brevundimonas sp. Root1423]